MNNDSTRAAGKIPQQNDPSVKKGKNYILAIGIDEYTHCPKLKNAVKDIKDFVTLLTDKFGFHENSHITFLCNDEATYEHIFKALEYLIDNVKDVDNVLIYFSGHGEFYEKWGGYWIPFEAKQGNRKDCISNNDIQAAMEKINSLHTLLIVDSCYSGSLFLDGKSKFVSDSYDFPSRWGLTSGRNTIVNDGKAGTNSPFAAALLSALRHLDKPMNVSALCDSIKQAVPAATNKLQTPIGDPLKINGHLGGQFVFYPQNNINPEITYWKAVKDENTEGAYKDYLRKYAQGLFLKEAEAALKKIALWQKTIEKNTLLGYNYYLEQYPTGRFARDADNYIDAINNKEKAEKEEIDRQEAERNKAEDKLWVLCRKTHTPSVYLEKFPKGRFAEQASKLKHDIEAAEKQKPITESNRKEKERLVQWEIERKKQEAIAQKNEEESARKKQFEPEMIVVRSGTFSREYTYIALVKRKEKTGFLRPFSKTVREYVPKTGIQTVNINSFSIGKYPVTQALWQAVMGNNPSHFEGHNLPVENVNWNDCQAFIEKLNEKTGKKYRLPTEAEWEFAARGGNQSNSYTYSGSNNIDEVAWYDANSDNKTHPVGTKKANELGIHDMSGNVWEWCQDGYAAYQSTAAVTNPIGTGASRVYRGGSWNWDMKSCHVAFRSYSHSDSYYYPIARSDRYYYLGFRLVLY
jgi:formylglycine-generating enzyme